MTDTATPKEVIFYADANGREPFTKWLNGLRDPRGRRHVVQSLHKLREGGSVDRQPVGKGVSELRLHCGPGYRVYLGEHGSKIVVLLGGDKDSQNDDIQQAKDYWKDYKNREKL